MAMTSRLDLLLKHVTPTAPGIEIAPYFNPALPKRAGCNVRIFDVFDTETLRARARENSFIPDSRIAEIEAVDFVGDACRIGAVLGREGLLGRFDHIVSSHNFEHLANPILFLQGAAQALKPGGVLSMAIPDGRACFDHFRFPTRLGDWLLAYHTNRDKPDPVTLFDAHGYRALYWRGADPSEAAGFLSEDPAQFRPEAELQAQYRAFVARLEAPYAYTDAHCSVLFPELFELHLRELHHLGLVDFEILEIVPTQGHEFFVHLRKPVAPAPQDTPQDADDFHRRRAALLRAVALRMGETPFLSTPRWEIADRDAAHPLRALLKNPRQILARLRIWNRQRRQRRRAKRAAR
ncbi:class I SAM-dependent methyltransferase [Rhodobacter capsulatus]|uniref:class I SAM-dependent methyltransferase n=1 Tax=Rhodobacter capsulatus TaxID=1061 RepID=UPI004025142E